MARKNQDYEKEKNPFMMVLYIAAVLILLCCIVFFAFRARKQRAQYQETVKQLQVQEEDYGASGQEWETEMRTLKNILDETEGVPKETETEAPTESESETESETESVDYDMNIVILNGTGTEGVAGYWQSELKKEGYTNVVSASYGRKSEENTLLIAETREKAEPLSDSFQNARIQVGQLEDKTEIETAEGVKLPEEVDVWVIVGKEDVKKE